MPRDTIGRFYTRSKPRAEDVWGLPVETGVMPTMGQLVDGRLTSITWWKVRAREFRENGGPGHRSRPTRVAQNVNTTSAPTVKAPESLNETTPVVLLTVLLNTLLPPNDWS